MILRVCRHDVAHLLGDGAHLHRIGADHAELHREADRRSELEAVDARARLGQRAVGERFSSRALTRSRASRSLVTMTICAKFGFGSTGLRPSQKRGEPWPT